MCVNSCATTFMIIFEYQQTFVRDVAHLRIIILCNFIFFSYIVSFSHISKSSEGRSQLFVGPCVFLGEDNSL